MRKLIIALVILLAIATGGYFAWKWWTGRSQQGDTLKLIPPSAVFIVETDNPIEAWRTFSQSLLWKHVKNYSPLGEIGQMADVLDKNIEENNLMFSVFGKRDLWISAHVVNKKDYDFLYVTDLQKAGEIKGIKEGMIELLKSSGFTHRTETFNTTEIHRFFDASDKSTLYLYFSNNLVACSFNRDIIEESINQSSSNELSADPSFTEVINETSAGSLCKIYLNHKMVPDYLGVYMDDAASLKPLFESMKFSGLSAEMDDDGLQFNGITNLSDSLGSHINAIAQSGSSKTGAHRIFSNKTAFLFSMGFESFNKFYSNLSEVLKRDEKSWREFEKNKKNLETFLGINMEEHFFSWIGDEVAVANYEQERVIGGKVHKVIAIKANSIDKAKSALADMNKKIRRRTPLRFDTQKFRDYDIHYLEMKGMFKWIFGKLFKNIEKPYYTYVGDYVVFCDDPSTLLHTIVDYESKNTLSSDLSFSEFYDKFDNKSSVFSWVDMKKYFLDMKGLLSAESWRNSYQNRSYILCFHQLGFQFSERGGRLDTRLHIGFKQPDEKMLNINEGKAIEIDSLDLSDSMPEVDAFLLEHIYKNVKKEYFDNGKLKFLAEIDNSELHGKYLEYWENGNIKIKGKYKKGKKTGRWRYYNEDGELERKERFGRKEDSDESTDSLSSPSRE